MTPKPNLDHLINQLTEQELTILRFELQRRPTQTAPDPLPFIWFLLGGRFGGKTWTGSNHIYQLSCEAPPTHKNRTIRVALVGETFDDVKATMVEGESGILNIIPDSSLINWNRSTGELKLRAEAPDGSYREIHLFAYTSERPDKLRGPQFHFAWIDEPAKFKDAHVPPTKEGTTFSNLIFGLRLGHHPHIVVTGTPTPCALVKYLVAHPDCATSRMSSWDNINNMPINFQEELKRLPQNSRTARQEIYAEILDENPDALFYQEVIDNNRQLPPPASDLIQILGFDPSGSDGENSDEAGIILVGVTPAKPDQPTEAYVLQDLSSRLSPSKQTMLVMETMLSNRADVLVFERNQGDAYVMTQLEQALAQLVPNYSIRKLKSKKSDYGNIARYQVTAELPDDTTHKFIAAAVHVQHGKQTRADIASLKYDLGQVHHPILPLTHLETQMVEWNPLTTKKSPDRLDALCHALIYAFGTSTLRTRARGSITAPKPTDKINVDQYQTPLPTALTRNPAATRTVRTPGNVGIYSVDILNRR